MNIKVDNLASEVNKMLAEYKDVVFDGMESAIDEAGNTAKRVISERAPKNTGSYSKSWKKKKSKESSSKVGMLVYASGRSGSITHLLENGHAKRGGGRTKAYPHISPAQDAAEEKFINDLNKVLAKG